jgi:alpha-galactosidase
MFGKKAWMILMASCVAAGPLISGTIEFGNAKARIRIVNSGTALWQYGIAGSGKIIPVEGPIFEIDGKSVRLLPASIRQTGGARTLRNGALEYTVAGDLRDFPDLQLNMVFRVSKSNPVVRFRYELSAPSKATTHALTKNGGKDRLRYFSVPFRGMDTVKEIRFSEFNEMVHSFCLSERPVDDRQFGSGQKPMGPLMAGSGGGNAFLVGYEHGSQAPDAFLEFTAGSDMAVSLDAVKGNYYNGQSLTSAEPYRSLWFEIGGVRGGEEDLAEAYRSFILHDMTQNLETRKPYVFYNTWNFQERNRHWNHKKYLDDLNLKRVLEEIDAAHRMGIDVYVIDTGWYGKTGDWNVSLKRFPDGLRQVKAKLDGYGMKLGLWFNPNAAAVSSKMFLDHRDCVKTKGGKEEDPYPVWETEKSYSMCLVSRYRDAFADELIRISKELGVMYFKWDAIAQYGCDDPRHFHGTGANSPREREENFAFQVGPSMSYVVDKLCAACPEAIVDFDITEGGRAVGLGFLSSGKYFLINNGPYYFNYNIPFNPDKDNWNLFFYPGPARGWICRTPLTFDKWLPSVCFMTHYLPDDPYENQSICAGSLILGQNGIWGDLPKVSSQGVEFFGKTLGLYKQVRDDVTEAALIRDGAVGGSPEVYEKINPANGRGEVVVFSSHPGTYRYVTRNAVDPSIWKTRGTSVSFDPEGRAIVETEFAGAEAKIVFFGVKE